MKINPRERTLLTVTALAALGLLAWRVGVRPFLDYRADLAAEVTDLESQLALCDLSLQQKADIEERYRKIDVDIQQKGTDEQVIARLLQEIRKQYSSLPLADKGAKLLPVEEGGFYRKFSILLELEGPMPALADFLGIVASAKDPLKIEQLNVRASGSDGGQERVRSSVVISAAYTSAASAGLRGTERE
jgi:Tfp pilus assembly protein PilO